MQKRKPGLMEEPCGRAKETDPGDCHPQRPDVALGRRLSGEADLRHIGSLNVASLLAITFASWLWVKIQETSGEHQNRWQMAVAQKPVPKWVALVSGNMDQNLRYPSSLILSHTQMDVHPPQNGAIGYAP